MASAIYALLSMGVAPFSFVCSACHSREGSTHLLSKHAEVSCSSCHSGNTPTDRLNFRISIVRMIPSTVFLSKREGTPLTPLIKNETCNRCHASRIRTALVARGIKVSHAEIIAGGYQCVDCHASTGHSLSSGSSRQIDMFDCFKCHSKSAASCESCHIGQVKRERRAYASVWQLTHGENWRQLHGMGDIETCRVCHQPKYCAKCHQIEIPHPGEFLFLHGYLARSVDFKEVCSGCHNERSFCFSCHQVEMPHPEDYLKVHSTLAEKDEQKCFRCHLRSSCDRCHARHTHPGIPKEVLRELRGRLKVE